MSGDYYSSPVLDGVMVLPAPGWGGVVRTGVATVFSLRTLGAFGGLTDLEFYGIAHSRAIRLIFA